MWRAAREPRRHPISRFIAGRALSPNANHMVLVKKGLMAADGDSYGADWTWALFAASFRQLSLATSIMWLPTKKLASGGLMALKLKSLRRIEHR